MNRIDFNDISPYSKLTSVKFDVISLILHEHQSSENFRSVVDIPYGNSECKFTVIFRRSDTVNAAYTTHDNDIIP